MIAHRADEHRTPKWRTQDILAALDRLQPGEELRLRVDYEPRALRHACNRRQRERFVWVQHQLDEDEWLITVRRPIAVLGQGSADDFFAHCPVLEGCSERTRVAFASCAMTRHIAWGEAVVEQGAAWPYLGFVRDGGLDVIAESRNARGALLFEIQPYETFAEISVVDGSSIIGRMAPSRGAAEIAVVGREVVLHAMAHDAAFAESMTLVVAQRGRALANRVSFFAGQSVTKRMARTLVAYASSDCGLAPALPTVTQMSQGQLATAIGTIREMAARALFDLAKAGAVALEGGRVVRIDRARLLQFL